MSAALPVRDHDEPGSAGIRADVLEGSCPVGAKGFEKRQLNLHPDDVRANRVHESRTEAGTGVSRRCAAGVGAGPKLDRQQLCTRVEPHEELAPLPPHRLGHPVSECSRRDRGGGLELLPHERSLGYTCPKTAPTCTDGRIPSSSRGETASSGGGRRRNGADEEKLVGSLGVESRTLRLRCPGDGEPCAHFEDCPGPQPPGASAHRRPFRRRRRRRAASPAPPPGRSGTRPGSGADRAFAGRARPLRGPDAVAQLRRLLVAKRFGQVAQTSPETR